MNPSNRIILAGGSGFIGAALAHEFTQRGHEVVILTRSPRPRPNGVREVAWDGKNSGDWVQLLDGAETIINLTGKNINCPHTPENLRKITASRVDSVNAIAQAITQVKTPPRTWIQSSATGFYGDTGNDLCDETSPSGHDALAKVCREWEAAFTSSPCPQTRKVILRLGVVLGHEGGAFPILLGLTKAFLGGAAGSGRQYISWIHLSDLTQIFVTASEQKDLQGTFNAVAPNPVRNAEFMRELRGTLHRPWSPPVPKFAIKLGAWLTRSDPSLSLTSQRCAPQRLMKVGFVFKFSHLRPALDDLCA
jgi:uncharacterized protein (TIGR01777 family)